MGAPTAPKTAFYVCPGCARITEAIVGSEAWCPCPRPVGRRTYLRPMVPYSTRAAARAAVRKT
jgi:hypothetical protein